MSDEDFESIEPREGEWNEKALSRRKVLAALFWLLAGTGGAASLGVAGRFLVGLSLEPKKRTWVDTASVDSLPPGSTQRFAYSVRAMDAWRQTQQSGVVFARLEADGNATVFDGTCTHLGCTVRWDDDAQHFACPCHAGIFAADGEVVSGPPPAPLRRLEAKVEDGTLKVLV